MHVAVVTYNIAVVFRWIQHVHILEALPVQVISIRQIAIETTISVNQHCQRFSISFRILEGDDIS